MIFRSFLLLFCLPFPVSAAELFLPSHCYSSSVRKIMRPFGGGSSGSFEYRFHVNQEDTSTLLIFLPGGPGEVSMSAPLSLPNDVTVVRTDPRGVGCNETKETFPSESQSTELIAKDILAIVRELKPKSYFLYGTSYGTMVATVAASLAEKEGVPLPSAIILEGVLSKTLNENYLSEYISRWKKVRERLPLSVQKLLRQEDLPLGFSAKEWGAWILYLLLYGERPGAGDFLLYQLSSLDPAVPEGRRKAMSMVMKKLTASVSSSRLQLYRNITCREINHEMVDQKYDVELVAGELVPMQLRLCKSIAMDRPYDASRYPVSVPIFYFSGMEDPALSEDLVRFHMEANVANKEKRWISVPGAGHFSLSSGLADCSDEVWQSILSLGNGLEQALKQCSLHPTLRTGAPVK